MQHEKPAKTVGIKNDQQKAIIDFKNQSSGQESLVVHDLKNETFDKLQNPSQASLQRIKFPDNLTNSLQTGKLSTREKTGPTRTLQTQEERDENPKKLEMINIPKKGSLNVVCEPSIVEKDESEESSSGDFEGRIDFNQKSQEVLEVSDEDLIVRETEKQTKKKLSNSFSLKKPLKENKIVYVYKTVQTEIDDDFMVRSHKRKRNQFGQSLERKSSGPQDPTADASCNVPLQTGDEDPSKDDKIKEMNSKSDIALKQHFSIRNNTLMFGSYLKVPVSFEDPTIYRKDVEHNNSNIKLPSEPSDEGSNQNGAKPEETKDIHNIHIQIDNDPHQREEPERNHSEMFFVEKRYCTVCNVEQAFRAKHCRDCDRCIARYDHHCPWLGNCIGERNHFWFYWYLVFQVTEIVLSQVKLFLCIFDDSEGGHLYAKIILLAVATIFFAMTASLLVFHTYLALANLSTWERMSWNRITYLSDWPKQWGSPFSKGALGNLRYFCCGKHKELVDWQMPKYKLPRKLQP